MPSTAASDVTSAAQAPAVRDRILDVAEALFAERGLAGTSVRDIASRVGLTAASLYNHFAGKEALYRAVLERGIRPLIELMRAFAEGPDVDDPTDELIRRVMGHLRQRPHLPRLFYHEAVAGGAHLDDLVQEWVRPLLAYGLDEMERREDLPWDRPDYPHVIAAWIHLVLGPFALAPLYREVLAQDPLSPAMLERHEQFLRKLARLLDEAGRRRRYPVS